MPDPFQTQRRAAPAAPVQRAMGPLRDTSPEARLPRPRSRGFLHAIELLDALTAGDEALYASLSAEAAKPRPAPNPFAPKPAGETDPLEAMLREPPPSASTQAFRERKEELDRQCRELVQAESARQTAAVQQEAAVQQTESVQREETARLEDKVVYLAVCSIPLHVIHWIDEEGNVLRHYRPRDLDTPLLRLAAELLRGGYILVEVHGGFPEATPGTVLYAARKSGTMEKVTF